MLLEGLFSLLTTYTPLTSIVGTRITPSVLAKNYTVPAVTYFLVTNGSDVAMDATAISTDHVEIDTWANTYHDVKYAQQALHELLDAFTGVLSDGTVVIYTGSNDNPDFFENDSLLYRSSTTFIFQHD